MGFPTMQPALVYYYSPFVSLSLSLSIFSANCLAYNSIHNAKSRNMKSSVQIKPQMTQIQHIQKDTWSEFNWKPSVVGVNNTTIRNHSPEG